MAKKGNASKGTRNDAVMKLVERELGKNPGIQTSELQEKAKAVDASMGKLSLRQFNARYPLQVKRKAGLGKPKRARRSSGGRRSRAGAPANREAVREIFMGFAADLAAATEQPKELVRLLAQVDRYVDETLKAARK